MVCAMLPLFTMKGPEGQIFRPMAETYAFALGGALLLARDDRPGAVPAAVQEPASRPATICWSGSSRRGYLRNLERCLNHRGMAVGGLRRLDHGRRRSLLAASWAASSCRRWKKGTSGSAASFRSAFRSTRTPSSSRHGPGHHAQVSRSRVGRLPDGPARFGRRPDRLLQRRVLRAAQAATRTGRPRSSATGWWRWFAAMRPRTKPELVDEMSAELNEATAGRELELFAGDSRQRAGSALRRAGRELGQDHRPRPRRVGDDRPEGRRGAEPTCRASRTSGCTAFEGQCNSSCRSTAQKCSLWNISVADVHNVIQTAIGGKTVSQMIEGEKSFDITIRWPERLREDESDILDIPVDVTGHQVTDGTQAGDSGHAFLGRVGGHRFDGHRALRCPSLTGSTRGTSPLEVDDHAARAAGRPGHAAGRHDRRPARSRTASSCAPAHRRSPARRAAG